MTNAHLSAHLIQELRSKGVEEFCICPSSRNAPFVALLKAHSKTLKAFHFFEERSMAFFALGRIRATGRPVAVITTSGTAAGELLPAVMEAHYAGLPLVVLTTDRPRRYRGSGAPQSAEQVQLFGVYVSHSLDLEGEAIRLPSFPMDLPFHLNVCFDEPLLDESEGRGDPTVTEWGPLAPLKNSFEGQLSLNAPLILRFLEKVKAPFIVVGALHPEERESVVQLLEQWGVPVYLEGLSGLREEMRLKYLRVHVADRLVERMRQADYMLDGVVRIGGVPTFRFWRDLESKLGHLPVLSISRLSFSGLARHATHLQGEVKGLCREVLELLPRWSFEKSKNALQRFFEIDREVFKKLEHLLEEEPESESGMIHLLSKRMPLRSQVYVGNSLPIREWDLAATREARNYEVWGSRGLNGIDGQISTFLGFCREETENWAILGDLTTLYDLPGPWILSQRVEVPVRLVVVNNGGGKIFSRLFPYPEFQNNHQIRFKPWAEMWCLNYEEWREVPEYIEAGRSHKIIEMLPDEEATQRFWKKFQQI